MSTNSSKNRATSYTDFYKKSSKVPGSWDDEEEGREEGFRFRVPKGRSVTPQKFRKRIEEEEENKKMAAIRRRLKLASQLKSGTSRRSRA